MNKARWLQGDLRYAPGMLKCRVLILSFGCLWLGLFPPKPLVAGNLPGLAAAPRPGPVPVAWGAVLNDAFGGGLQRNADDFRTQTLYGAYRFGAEDRWMLGLDYSFLTNKGNDGDGPRGSRDAARVDELTVTAGRVLAQQVDRRRGRFGWLVAGLGARYTGDLAGDTLQNELHDLFAFDLVELPYETTRETQALAFVHGSRLRTQFSDEGWLRWWPQGGRYGELGLGLEGGLLVTGLGEVQGALEGQLVVLGRDGALWAGLRREVREGDTPDATSGAVARREDGWWITYGVSLGNVFFEGGQHLESDAAIGRVGWLWRPETPPPEGEARLTGEVTTLVGGPGVGLRLRVHSQTLDRMGAFGRRSTILGSVAYGNASGEDPPSQTLRFQQFLVGMDTELRDRGPGFQVVPYLYLAAGLRREQLETDGPRARFDEVDTARAVLQGGVGLRFLLGRGSSENDGLRYAFGVSVDGWIPAGAAEVANPVGETFEFLEPRATVSVQVSVLTDW